MKRLLWLAAGTLLAQSATEWYARANEAFEKRDLENARSAVEQALRADPKLVPALILQAKLAMAANQLAEARQAVERAIAADPKHPYARFLLGFVLYLQNDFEPARAALAAANQKDPRVALYSALTEEGLNHLEAATALYERTLKLDTATIEGRIAYARLLFKQGDPARAEQLIDEALRRNSNDADALYEKARCLFERGEYAASAQAAERALVAPGAAALERRIRYQLVRAYQKAGNQEMAEKHRAVFETLPNPLVR
jgi:tetratricopeptide (TPR) repeat protein